MEVMNKAVKESKTKKVTSWQHIVSYVAMSSWLKCPHHHHIKQWSVAWSEFSTSECQDISIITACQIQHQIDSKTVSFIDTRRFLHSHHWKSQITPSRCHIVIQSPGLLPLDLIINSFHMLPYTSCIHHCSLSNIYIYGMRLFPG